MAPLVRKFTFATQFCDTSIVYFRLFPNSKPFFHVSLHFVCTFRRCFFLPLAILALHPLFYSTIRNKKQRGWPFRTHPRCSSVQFNTLTLCSD